MLFLAAQVPAETLSESNQLDFAAVFKKSRSSVMTLMVFDASGNRVGTATGFLVSSDGKLITNRHVAGYGVKIMAKAEDGHDFPVSGVLAEDSDQDLVLLKIDGKDFPFLTLVSSANLRPGVPVAIVGNQGELAGQGTTGSVSKVSDVFGYYRWIEITATLSLGSSGSPVLNSEASVVAVNSGILHQGQSQSFVIPAEIASSLLAASVQTTNAYSLASLARNREPEIWWEPEYRAFGNAFIAHDDAEAMKRITGLLARYPKSALVHLSLAIVHWRQKSYPKAIVACEQAISLRPDYATAWHFLGAVRFDQGQYSDAITAIQKAVKLKPTDAEVWRSLGLANEKQGQHDKAVSAYLRAVDLQPDFAIAWAQLGAAYSAQRKDAEAIDALEHALRVNPEIAEAWGLLGGIHYSNQAYANAKVAFQKATKLAPNNADAWRNLGLSCTLLNEYGNAVVALEESIKLKPGSAETLIGLCVAYTQLGQRQKALDALAQLEKVDPQRANELAKDLQSIGR